MILQIVDSNGSSVIRASLGKCFFCLKTLSGNTQLSAHVTTPVLSLHPLLIVFAFLQSLLRLLFSKERTSMTAIEMRDGIEC